MPSNSETTPLRYREGELEDNTKVPKRTPLPKSQIAIVCLTRLVDPIAFSQIFPYVNEFVTTLHITNDPTRVGFYSGLIESAFSLAQLCSVYHWAKLSDRIGRRPVIIAGFVGIILSTLVFGLSKSLAMLLIGRAIGGLFSGNSAAINSTFAELTDPSNQAAVYPIFGICWPLGAILGPIIGGQLSNAASKYGSLDYALVREHPYFLPCVATSIIGAFGIIVVSLFLRETLPRKQPGFDHATGAPHVSISLRSMMSIPIVRDICTSGGALSFVGTSYEVLITLFCFSPVATGGLGFSPAKIGDILALSGALSIMIQVLFTPVLMRRFSAGRLYSTTMAVWPIAFLLLPAVNYVVRHDIGSSKALMWIGLSLSLLLARIGSLGYTFSLVLVKKYAPPGAMGSTNASVHCAMCFSRAFSPVLSSSMFAWSVESRLLGGYWWALLMAAAGVFGLSLTRRIARLDH